MPGKKAGKAKSVFWVYLLQCADKSLYCGCTNDLDARLKAHNAGRASRYTRARLPARLVYAEAMRSRGSALRREAEIKSFRREKKLLIVSSGNRP